MNWIQKMRMKFEYRKMRIGNENRKWINTQHKPNREGNQGVEAENPQPREERAHSQTCHVRYVNKTNN